MSRPMPLLIALIVTSALACRPTPVPDPEPLEPTANEEVTVGETDDHTEALRARAPMYDAEGNHLGDLHFEQISADEMRVHATLSGLPPTIRGFHVHEHGVCDPPTFETAGGHFNPHGHPHGGPDDDPTERHVGDFGNIIVAEDGTAEIDFTDSVATLNEGTNQIVGYSVIIHEGRDDLETQPTGDAGPRIACGIIEWVD